MRISDLDSEVLAMRLNELLGDERNVQVEFLLHLEEFDRRRQYESKGYESLWQFCRRELLLLEGATYRRTTAMRLIRTFPEAIGYLRDGRLFMTTLVVLKDVLTSENASDLFERASHQSKDDVEILVARLKAPRPVPPTRISKIPCAPVERELPGPSLFSTSSEPEVRPVPPPVDSPAPTEVRTMIRMSVSAEFMAAFEEAKLILSHSVPDGDCESILRRGLDAIIEKAAKRNGVVAVRRRKKKASMIRASDSDSTPRADAARSAIPADVHREVWQRDGGRCVWPVESRGKAGVCGSGWMLEVDHVVPFARGGKSDTSNLRLCCRGHNSLHARRKFGESWMKRFEKQSRLPRGKVPKR
jgi:5-methylcytosine-specific restriction endonuclease McrA